MLVAQVTLFVFFLFCVVGSAILVGNFKYIRNRSGFTNYSFLQFLFERYPWEIKREVEDVVREAQILVMSVILAILTGGGAILIELWYKIPRF